MGPGASPGDRPVRPEADRCPELQDANSAVAVTPAAHPTHRLCLFGTKDLTHTLPCLSVVTNGPLSAPHTVERWTHSV